MAKRNLKDKLEGNELDLSLSGLTDVPVKEIAALPKATSLDLSCNLLVNIPADFCRLTQVVKLDLSKNKIIELPKLFGDLVNLQHLDLYQNQLESLPLTFCQLRSLKWLDLKDNPLNLGLQKVAGDCLSDAQCKTCAINVVRYMAGVAEAEVRTQLERQELMKKQEQSQKAKDEQKRKERERKKLIKERKRRQDVEKNKEEAEQIIEDQLENGHGDDEIKTEEEPIVKDPAGRSCFSFLPLLLLCLLMLLCYAVLLSAAWCSTTYSRTDQPSAYCSRMEDMLEPIWPHVRDITKTIMDWFFQPKPTKTEL